MQYTPPWRWPEPLVGTRSYRVWVRPPLGGWSQGAGRRLPIGKGQEGRVILGRQQGRSWRAHTGRVHGFAGEVMTGPKGLDVKPQGSGPKGA